MRQPPVLNPGAGKTSEKRERRWDMTPEADSPIYLDPAKRHDFVLFFDVRNGNPNGDPDAENMPRQNPVTRHGLVTDVAIKRKVRDYVARHPERRQEIFIQSKVALNTLILRAFQDEGVQPLQAPVAADELLDWLRANAPQESGFTLEGDVLLYAGESNRQKDIERTLKRALEADDENRDNRELERKLRDLARNLAQAARAGQRAITDETRLAARARLCRTYYDVRMFGAVLQTGLNAGQVRGPAQFTFAQSLDPIHIQDHTITRQGRTTTARMETGTTEMGRKPQVAYALYRAHGFFNPFFAGDTGAASEDLGLFWEALERMWDLDRSATRGEMACRGIYIFSHDSALGNAAAHRLFELLRVAAREEVKEPGRFQDYLVTFGPDAVPVEQLLHTGRKIGAATIVGSHQAPPSGVTLTILGV
jgi:CRISPR-associated protein Csd2